MDLALISTLMPSLAAGISRVLVSYGIGCQWGINLKARFKSYALPTPDVSKLQYWKVVIPKFHLSGHGAKCQVIFNLNYTKWAGRTDGERIEAGWAQSTSMATWTRETSPNARRNILDDHWNATNWRKLLGLGEQLAFYSVDLPLISLIQVSFWRRTSDGPSSGRNLRMRLQP
jgi:hypothetical protein